MTCCTRNERKFKLKVYETDPWLSEAMKDVISCEKPRLGANSP